MKHKCSDQAQCPNLYSFLSGGCSGVSCRIDGCEVGFATTYSPAYVGDATQYQVFIKDWGSDWKKSAVWISTRFSMSVSEARSNYQDQSILFEKRAFELHALFGEFEAQGIEIATDPEYPHSRSDLEEGEWPLSIEEQEALAELMQTK